MIFMQKMANILKMAPKTLGINFDISFLKKHEKTQFFLISSHI
jgi:hypothetical protein